MSRCVLRTIARVALHVLVGASTLLLAAAAAADPPVARRKAPDADQRKERGLSQPDPAHLELERARLQLDQTRSQLDQQRLELERTRLQHDQLTLALAREQQALARERLAHDKRNASLWYNEPLFGWLLALIGIPISWLLTRQSERWKHGDSLQIEQSKHRDALDSERERHRLELIATFDQELRKGRIDAYQALWTELKPLSLYTDATFERADAATLRLKCRDWYFKHGLYLSEGKDGTREPYFALQQALVLVSQGKGADRLANPHDAIKHSDAEADEHACADFDKHAQAVPEYATKTPFMEYRFLRALGSRLRTATVRDVQTRVAALRIAEQAATAPHQSPTAGSKAG